MAYCVKCNEKREMRDAVLETIKDKNALIAKCGGCAGKLFRWVGSTTVTGLKAMRLKRRGSGGWRGVRKSYLTQYPRYAQHIGVKTKSRSRRRKQKSYLESLLRLKWYGIDDAEEKAIDQSVIALEALSETFADRGDLEREELGELRATRTTMGYN